MNTIRALEILGYTEKDEPSRVELKKRFRVLSLKNHPDKGGNSDTFRNINRAYRILIGEEQADVLHTHTSEMFHGVFQGFDELFTKFKGKKVHNPVKKRVRLRVHELFEGATREIEFVKGESCKKCTGTGKRRGSTIMCGACNGTKMEYTKLKKSIPIPRGIKHNARIIIGENTETPIELIIQHPNQTDKEWNGWYLNENTRNLELKHTISLKDAMLGNIIALQHPNNTTLDCVIPAGTQPNDIITFKDKGLPPCPSLKMPPTNALIKINITIPKIDNPESTKITEAFFTRITQPGAS